jgi:hypothetical protein
MERLEIIETLKHMPDLLEAEVAGLDEQTLRYRPAEGEWSVIEVVGHLCLATQVWHKRLYMVWSLFDPVLAKWDTIVGPDDFKQGSLRQLLDETREWRLQTVDLLAHAVDWSRLGQHIATNGGFGRRTFKQIAEHVLNHDAEHLAQIRALKAARGVTTAV